MNIQVLWNFKNEEDYTEKFSLLENKLAKQQEINQQLQIQIQKTKCIDVANHE